ncbi:hypothetical protein pEaSNUABM54_00251 [Erwinia phage pEa_SNUABM_54]|nr:hypothetical protein pEaSNUABM54_00251 [Erwinia phage pEa_SNUABM_54]
MSRESVIGMRMRINVIQNIFRYIDTTGDYTVGRLEDALYLLKAAIDAGGEFTLPPKIPHINVLFQYNEYPMDLVYGKILKLFGMDGDTNDRRIAMAVLIGTTVRIETLIKFTEKVKLAEAAGMGFVVWKP